MCGVNQLNNSFKGIISININRHKWLARLMHPSPFNPFYPDTCTHALSFTPLRTTREQPPIRIWYPGLLLSISSFFSQYMYCFSASYSAIGTPCPGHPTMSALRYCAAQSPLYSILSYFCTRRITVAEKKQNQLMLIDTACVSSQQSSLS